MSALAQTLSEIAERHSPAVLANSLQAEDLVLTHAIATAGLPIGVFVLDTGRLHAETLGLIDAIRQRYSLQAELYRPQAAAVENYVQLHGRHAFYGSLELRQRCCGIRKVEPLARALAGKRAWI